MKRIEEQNYYDLLDISPRASLGEIRSAYDQAMTIYAPDSLSTYSLLTKREREVVLSRLTEAYKTLTDNHLRKEYNHFLIERGELSPQALGLSSLEDTDIAEGKLVEVSIESLNRKQQETTNQHISSKENLSLFDGHMPVTGKIIKTIRIEKDMSLEEIFKQTNISREILEDIEEERFEKLPALVYLRGFLRAYAKVLHVDQSEMMDGYVKRYLEWKNTYQK